MKLETANATYHIVDSITLFEAVSGHWSNDGNLYGMIDPDGTFYLIEDAIGTERGVLITLKDANTNDTIKLECFDSDKETPVIIIERVEEAYETDKEDTEEEDSLDVLLQSKDADQIAIALLENDAALAFEVAKAILSNVEIKEIKVKTQESKQTKQREAKPKKQSQPKESKSVSSVDKDVALMERSLLAVQLSDEGKSLEDIANDDRVFKINSAKSVPHELKAGRIFATFPQAQDAIKSGRLTHGQVKEMSKNWKLGEFPDQAAEGSDTYHNQYYAYQCLIGEIDFETAKSNLKL